ncbi:hypothetical protein [Winogradskyella ludwigii]|uniref:hypothetical protein n=1 Tax=Winogradskyella ludwigii TaxID=2686076 RepID=UPI0015CB050B|nr:hypothetical protein [Winogradskyella ludwigii]
MKINVLFLFFSIGLFAQNDKTLVFNQYIELEQGVNVKLASKKLVSDYSFDKLILKDLSYLLLGETSPSEGLEATFNEDKNKISLSGGIFSGQHYLVTAKGDFSTTDKGIYFFDENNGSTDAKISINYFHSIWSTRKYFKPIKNKKVQRGFYKIETAKRKKIADLLKDYHYSWILLTHKGIPVENLESTIEELNAAVKKYDYVLELEGDFVEKVDSAHVNTFIKEKKISSRSAVVIQSIIIEDDDAKKVTLPIKPESSENIHDLKLESYDIEKAITLYEKTLTSIDSITDIISTTEIEQAQPYWNSKKLIYFGGSPFYTRETISKVYTFNESLPFNKQFNDAIGDLFGVDMQVGYFYQTKPESYSMVKTFYTRLTGQIARGSNVDGFKKQTYEFPSTIGDTLSTGIITNPNKIEGNYNTDGQLYNYGLKTSVGVEAYLYPSTHFGLFGQIGYSHVEFDTGKGKDSEIYNMRLGILINLKSKEKNFATLQFFADRSDLSKSPNSEDKDLRFGFKLGIPFYFKSQL